MTDTSIYTDPTAMTKDNIQLSIWNGTKWVELSNGLTINQINANVGAVQDAVKDAQSGIAQATTDAQNAVDTANQAISASDVNTTDISTVKANLDTVKTNLQSQINDNITNISSVNSDLTTAKANIASNTNAIKDNSGNISSLQDSASTLESDMTDAQGNITSLQQDSTSFKTEIGSLTTDNTTNKSNISSLQQTDNEITSSVASVQTQVNNSAVGTNLLTGTSQTSTILTTDTTGHYSDRDITKLVTVGSTYTYQVVHTYLAHTSNITVAYTDSNGNVTYAKGGNIPWHSDGVGVKSTLAFTVPTTAVKVVLQGLIWTSTQIKDHITYNSEKLEKGSVATDWLANPSDNASVTALSTVKQEADSISTTVASNKTSSDAQFSSINQTISGIQTTVSNKADSSTVTQLGTLVDSKVNSSDYNSEVAQLASDINLRVKSDDLLSQINIESGNILIQSNKIFLDASSVTFGGTAFITSAMISSLSADDIVTGTMTAGAINLGNGTFSVDTNGNLVANDATLTGTLISGSSDSYNYEVSSSGIIFKQGTTAFATLEGFAYGNNWEYVGLTGDNVSIGRVQGDALSGSYAYADISTQNGIEFQRGNPFNSDMASSSISIGATTTSGMDAINLMTLNEASKASATVDIYGYDAKNNKDTESIYMTVIDSNAKSSSIDVDSTGILLYSPNSTFELDNSIENATTLRSSEPNGIKVSTSSSPISVTAGGNIDIESVGGGNFLNTGKGDLIVGTNDGTGNVGLRGSIFYYDLTANGTRILYADSNGLQIRNGGLTATAGGSYIRNTRVDNELWVNGKLEATSLAVSGSKNSIVKTSKGWTLVNAYETAEYYFGDVGKTNTGDGSTVKVMMDSLYLETVNTNIPYHVFVSSYGNGYAWVSEMGKDYFIINSSVPNLEISYEIKAKRLGYENNRLEVDTDYDVDHSNVGV